MKFNLKHLFYKRNSIKNFPEYFQALELILQSLVQSMWRFQIRSKSKDKEVVERIRSKSLIMAITLFKYLGLTILTARLVFMFLTNNIWANKFTSCSIKTNKDRSYNLTKIDFWNKGFKVLVLEVLDISLLKYNFWW